MLPAGVNSVVVGGVKPVAKTDMLASVVTLGCCIYLPQVLISGNNRIVGATPALTNGFYGVRGNSNPFCNTPCPPDVLIATGGSTKNFVNGIGVLRLGDSVGVLGGIVLGTKSNTYCS
jgi:hypothetical protein